MPPLQLEPIMREAERHAILRVIQSHPEWTLEQLREYVEGSSPGAAVVGSLTIHELRDCDEREHVELPADGGPPIQRGRLERACRASREEFDACVVEVLEEAPRRVGAAYLRARLGGPRWKLLGALRRLIEAGVVERTGVTSGTLYLLRRAG